MLPLHQAQEIKYSLIEYFRATFGFKERATKKAFDAFIEHPSHGIFKGPYLSLRMPFVTADKDAVIPLDIKPSFPPYDHQYKAFLRLSTKNGRAPQPTLLTTGTGSGKTESFLYPILDFCYKNKQRKGVKVIILYPMNALATDQAKRLAEAIYEDTLLRGQITAGLFIGEGKDKKKFPDMMGADHIIENRNTIIDTPPDILLTNFKMLDYGLMQSRFHDLWQYNLEDPTLLQFLVLDELHTYDGAQGTDVANLIRRVKLKLNTPPEHLCPIGTSATLGSGAEASSLLAEYASKVFGESIDETAIITERRQSVDDFFPYKTSELNTFVPWWIDVRDSLDNDLMEYDLYLLRQKKLWKLAADSSDIALGEELKKLKITRDLIKVCTEGIVSLSEAIQQLSDKNEEFRKLPDIDSETNIHPKEEVVNSLLALICAAKLLNGKRKAPFLYVQVQIWIRELSGMLRVLSDEPQFTWRDKVIGKNDPKAMPAYFCRECGASGWLGNKHDNSHAFQPDVLEVYNHYFSHHKNIYFLNTKANQPIEEYLQEADINRWELDTANLSISDTPSNRSIAVVATRKTQNNKGKDICPECNTEDQITIIGTRIATMSSIAVSQILSSDLDQNTEKYRKILAFTNSVQDAAHQAGFIEARNYRFTFRSSLQQVIKQKGGMTIDELQQAFIHYWKENADTTGAKDINAYIYRLFPSDYKGKIDIENDYRELNDPTVFTQKFLKEFDVRMAWEVASEFGYNAAIGRTLEKTGASAVTFKPGGIQDTYAVMQDWLVENNLDKVITKEAFVLFISGILHRIRIRGGINHPYLEKYRENELKLWDLNWMKDSRHFLNRTYHPRSRFPKMITTHAVPFNSPMDSTFVTKNNNWYKNYYIKNFPLGITHTPLVNDFYQKVFEALTRSGMLNAKNQGEFLNYCINPNVIWVNSEVLHLECSQCTSSLNVAAIDKMTIGAKCLNFSCTGEYHINEKAAYNYYAKVYNRARSPRIYATEHTGLLERKDREQKEKDFKERPAFNSLNALVATSTLEMGIDIGTLNVAINNSVPPLTSNFLQRIGRAGRSTGSAMITNFAQNKAHDLFYFEEPKEMMQGDMNTPGCFMDAHDILFRHYLAYCIDSWTSNDAKNNSIPSKIIALRLFHSDLKEPSFIANRIISFAKANETLLLSKFRNIYEKDVSSSVLDELQTALNDDSFYTRLSLVFEKLKKEFIHIHERRVEIDKTIEIQNLANADEKRIALEMEKKDLWGLKRQIDNRSLLEHLTNVGVLPNYAFPETGVLLNATVRSYKAKESDNAPSNKTFEIVRPSRSAIRELAPENHFYSQGFRFKITGLNTYDWKDKAVLMTKRFCSNCDNIEDKGLSNHSTCSKCGSESWSAASNEHTFVRLTSVKSQDKREDATLNDSKDDRENTRYNITQHVQFNKQGFMGAYGMRDIPFGIEYVKNIDVSEVNLGISDVHSARIVTINQVEKIPTQGFITCRYCGCVTTNTFKMEKGKSIPKEAQDFHYRYCKHNDKNYKAKSDEYFEEVYLFRNIQTEAIKILLPVQDFEGDTTVNMFKAGLLLGMKRYYHGNPQHIEFTTYREFNPKNDRFDRFLVMYDVIPGGTGYLQKLFDPIEFSKLLRIAYEGIKECQCQYQGKDGCYRCIFTYTNQFQQEELSRKKAENLFASIVKQSDTWERLASGLSALSGTGQIEESELEDRFIRTLNIIAAKKEAEGWAFETEIKNGIKCYRIKIVNGKNTLHYLIQPQVNLGRADGVKFNTRADFLLTCFEVEKDNQKWNDANTLDAIPKIAIYLDGYIYHATKENLRFFTDLQRRNAIAQAGGILSWTLSWTDIEQADKEESDSLTIDRVLYKQGVDGLKKIPQLTPFMQGMADAKNNMERLIWRLANPFEEDKALQKAAYHLAQYQKTFGKPLYDSEALKPILSFEENINLDYKASNEVLKAGKFYMQSNVLTATKFQETRLFFRAKDLDCQGAILVKEDFNDTFEKSDWEHFWRIYNLIQLNVQLVFSTEKEKSKPIVIEKTADSDDLIFDYYDEEFHPILKVLLENNIDFDKEGSFILNGAEAVLGFSTSKIVIAPLSDQDQAIFEAAGYQVMALSSFNIKDIL